MIKRPFFIIFIILFCLYLLPVEQLFAALIILLFCETMLNHKRLRSRLFPGIGIYIYFLFTGLLVGMLHIFSHEYIARNVLKHTVYVFFPILFWLAGKNVYPEEEKDWELCITELFAAGVLISLYDLLNSLFNIFSCIISGMSLYGFRSMIGAGHPLTLITLFLYVFIPENITFKKSQVYCCIGLLTADLFIHFSRITLLNLLIFLIYSGYLRKPVKFFQFCTLLFVGTTTLYLAFPSIFGNYVDRFRNTLTEISYSHEIWDHASIVTNWRGYEAYCEILKFKNAGAFEKIFGGGFGSQLDVNGNAYLVTTEDTLPFLHNGYFSMLMIWGLLGCVFFIAMLILLYIGNPTLKRQKKSLWRAYVTILAVDTLFVHGPFFSPSAACLFFYLGILYLGEDETMNEQSLHFIHRLKGGF